MLFYKFSIDRSNPGVPERAGLLPLANPGPDGVQLDKNYTLNWFGFEGGKREKGHPKICCKKISPEITSAVSDEVPTKHFQDIRRGKKLG